ncbi:MAG: type II 3-dehydroquinate dehydratase [bacterium TMED80]|nr:MAG: type II 3-dehydroquinate dehydratase [bacterium TMED80]RZP22035.1 MAG: type II 3-dehydroquinate dehydratase [bacterium]
MNLLFINGPNLNLLGKRESDIYGIESLDQIINWVTERIKTNENEINWFQSNSEGKIIDKLHWALSNDVDGIIINPGAYTHYSIAIRDAISSIKIPTIEVHLSDIENRENFRKISVIKDVCISQISGLGKIGYLKAAQALIKEI